MFRCELCQTNVGVYSLRIEHKRGADIMSLNLCHACAKRLVSKSSVFYPVREPIEFLIDYHRLLSFNNNVRPLVIRLLNCSVRLLCSDVLITLLLLSLILSVFPGPPYNLIVVAPFLSLVVSMYVIADRALRVCNKIPFGRLYDTMKSYSSAIKVIEDVDCSTEEKPIKVTLIPVRGVAIHVGTDGRSDLFDVIKSMIDRTENEINLYNSMRKVAKSTCSLFDKLEKVVDVTAMIWLIIFVASAAINSLIAIVATVSFLVFTLLFTVISCLLDDFFDEITSSSSFYSIKLMLTKLSHVKDNITKVVERVRKSQV